MRPNLTRGVSSAWASLHTAITLRRCAYAGAGIALAFIAVHISIPKERSWIRSVHAPWILNGLVVPLTELADVRATNGRPDRPGPSLVLFSSDACPLSQNQSAQWVPAFERVVKDSQLGRIVLLHVRGGELFAPVMRAAASWRIPVVRMQASDQTGLIYRTGLQSTPTLLVLDDRLAVRYVVKSSDETAIDRAAVFASELVGRIDQQVALTERR